jgi:hypothetical protein
MCFVQIYYKLMNSDLRIHAFNWTACKFRPARMLCVAAVQKMVIIGQDTTFATVLLYVCSIL